MTKKNDSAARARAAVQNLLSRVLEACDAEFAKTWGEPFHAPGGLAEGRYGATFVEWHRALEKSKSLEQDAQRLFENVRKRLDRIRMDLRKFRDANNLGESLPTEAGIACVAIHTVEGALRNVEVALAPIARDSLSSTLSGHPEILAALKPVDGRTALVKMLIENQHRPPCSFVLDGREELTTRELAVVSLLVGTGPQSTTDGASPLNGWPEQIRDARGCYANGTEWTPPKVEEVIQAEIDRVRKVRNDLRKQPVR